MRPIPGESPAKSTDSCWHSGHHQIECLTSAEASPLPASEARLALIGAENDMQGVDRRHRNCNEAGTRSRPHPNPPRERGGGFPPFTGGLRVGGKVVRPAIRLLPCGAVLLAFAFLAGGSTSADEPEKKGPAAAVEK